ncbi:MAG: hypothetical protein IJH07_10640 [Ruminococcus sp.]|nr:hypothetical protein [Ruminococcus sp.]
MMVTWSGLYGRTFEKVGYSWSDVSRYLWKEGTASTSVTQSLMYGFMKSNNPYNLYQSGNNGQNKIYHYTEELDGTYDPNKAYTVYHNSNSVDFHFENKFNGFIVDAYTTNNFNNTKTNISAGDSKSVTLPIYVSPSGNLCQSAGQ